MRLPNARWLIVLPLLCVALSHAWPGTTEPEQESDERKRLECLWNYLAEADAAKAYQAILSLAQTPKQTTAFLKERLQPVAVPDSAKIKQWIDDLSNGSFALRNKASAELQKLAELAEPSLQSAAQVAPTLEAKRRIEELLSNQLGPVVTLPDRLRGVRAVEALEHIADNDAVRLLRGYAGGAPAARLTQEAAAALERLARRRDRAPVATMKKPLTDRYGDPLPAGAVARLGTVRFRMPSVYVTGLAFLPDGKSLLTGSHSMNYADGIQIWDVATGRLLRELQPELQWDDLALAPGGSLLAVSCALDQGSEIRVIDLQTEKVIKAFPRKNQGHFFLAFSPDGKLLFSLNAKEGVLRIDDVASGKELRQRKLPAAVEGGVALSTDGTYLAFGTRGEKLIFWNWRTEDVCKLAIPRYGAESVNFSPDGKLLTAVGGSGDHQLRVWEVPAGRLLYQQTCPGKNDYDGKAVFTPDGKTMGVATTDDRSSQREIHLLEPRTGKLQGKLDGPGYWIAASPDSRRLATAAGNRVRLWDLASRTEIGAIDEAHWRPVSQIRVSSSGLIATAGDDHSVRLWDGATGQQRQKFLFNNGTGDICFSPDGGVLVASSPDDSVPVWDTRTGREIYRLAGHGQRGSWNGTLGFLPDGRQFLSWGDDCYARLWDMKNGKAMVEHSIKIISDESGVGRSYCGITPDAKMLICSYGTSIYLFDAATGKEIRKFPGPGEVPGPIAVSPESKYLLTASVYGDVHQAVVRHLATGNAVLVLDLSDLHAGCVTFSPDGRSFAIGLGWPQSEVRVYETASGKVRCTIRGIRGPTSCLAFYPDNRRLAVGLNDSTVVIWDISELTDK